LAPRRFRLLKIPSFGNSPDAARGTIAEIHIPDSTRREALERIVPMRKLLGKLGESIPRPLLLAATLFLMFSAAFCHAQDGCSLAPPTAPSVSPSTWIAGKTTTVTVTGENFCWRNVWVTVPPGGGSVTTYGDSIAPYTEFLLTVTPDASDQTGTATVWVGNSDCNPNWAPCYPPASTTVQIVNKCTPTITSISPSTWFAGKTYDNVVIKGTGFTTSDKATAACPATAVVITAADGSAVPVSGVTVVDKTKITVTVAPDANTTTEQATITVGTAPNTGTSTALATQPQILGNEIQCDPSMNCTQPVISTTDGSEPPEQNVVVGQQIHLTTPALPSSIKATKTTWTVPTTPANIGAFKLGRLASNGSPSTASISPTVLKTASLTTYWLYTDSSVPVTYQYCADIPGVTDEDLKCSLVANVTFNVTGPTAQITTFQSTNDASYLTWGWSVSPGYTGCSTNPGELTQMLVFGMYATPGATCLASPLYPGIVFEATNINTAGVNAPNAKFLWVQLITGGQTTGTKSKGSVKPITLDTGLDNHYPYPSLTGTTAEDSPSSTLVNTWATQSKTFTAQMYLLWDSNPGPNAIPVPIGYETWSINGTADYTKASPPWTLSPSTIAAKAATSYTASNAQQPSYGMPVWTQVSLNTTTTTNESESVQTGGEEENEQ
jgi:hypothetical protein